MYRFFWNFWTIVIFAIFGTAISALVISFLSYTAGAISFLGITKLPYIDCFMFGALIAAVDPVATLGIFKVSTIINTL